MRQLHEDHGLKSASTTGDILELRQAQDHHSTAPRLELSLESYSLFEGAAVRVTQFSLDGLWRQYLLVETGVNLGQRKFYELTALSESARDEIISGAVVDASRDAAVLLPAAVPETTLAGLTAQEWFAEIEELARKVDDVIDRTRELTLPLVLRCETLNPGHYAGFLKFYHMEELTKDAARLGLREKLSAEDTLLLRLIARLHDIGRHIEFLQNEDVFRGAKRHGYLSAEFVEEHGILHEFSAAQSEVVLGAVVHHAQRFVDLEAGSPAWRLCYMFRDLDKEEIFCETARICTDREALFEHLWGIFFNDSERKLIPLKVNDSHGADLREFRSAFLDMLCGLLTSNTVKHRPFGAGSERAALMDTTVQIMNGDIAAPARKEFLARQTISIEHFRASQATCLLGVVAMVFDVHSNKLLRDIKERGYLAPYLDFIRTKTDAQFFAQIQSTLDDYFSKRLS